MGLVHHPNVVSDGIKFYWDFANRKSYPGTGTTWTDLAGGEPATLNNASFENFKQGVASFDGTDDWIEVSDTYMNQNSNSTELVNRNSPFTVSFWLMPTAAPTDGSFTQFSFRDGGRISPGSSLVIYWTPTGAWTSGIRWNFSGTYRYEVTDWYLDDYYNQWVNICLTYNGSGTNTDANWQMYFNNTAVTTPTGYGSGGGAWGHTRWGSAGDPYAHYEFIGNMANMLIYDRQLSADEVSQNYEATKSRFEPRITKSGLVGNWDAGDPQSYNGGTTWKDTANKNNGILENNGTNLNFNSANGGYFEFDGTDDSINLGSITSSNPLMCAGGPLSMCVWMYENSGAGSSTHPYVISKGTTDGTSGYSLMADFQGCIQVAANGQWCQTAQGVYSDDEWIYVVGTVDTDGNMRAYVNGVYYPNSSHSETGTPPSTTTNMRIGARSDGASYCGVSVAQVAIYNALLSDAEILDNYNKTKARFGH